MLRTGKTFVVILIIILTGIGFLFFNSPKVIKKNLLITNFKECLNAGYPVMETYPRQCRTPNGELFVEVVENREPTPSPRVAGKCFIGGCSAQICSDEEGMVSTCEYREEYACYKTATCERQSSGQCSWTETTQLNSCLNNFPSIKARD